MPEQRKIHSVLELARYQVGDVAWWVILRPIKAVPSLPEEDAWMAKHHPKALYTRGPCKELWLSRAILPKLQHMDFASIVGILTSKFKAEPFPVCDIIRSRETGEFFYCNENDEWMPESYLLQSKILADREISRVLRLLQKWIEDNKV
jgi:hypothetical protein